MKYTIPAPKTLQKNIVPHCNELGTVVLLLPIAEKFLLMVRCYFDTLFSIDAKHYSKRKLFYGMALECTYFLQQLKLKQQCGEQLNLISSHYTLLYELKNLKEFFNDNT